VEHHVRLCGQLSLGHAIFVGLGAYVSAMLLCAIRHRPMDRPRGRDRRRGACGIFIGFLAFRFRVAGV